MLDMIPAWVDGKLTPVEKLEVHRRGLRHKAVSVFVMDGEHMLMQRRAMGKYHTPGLWTNSCCTHPRWEEEAGACAARRLTEELGLRGSVLRKAGATEYRAEVGNGLIEHEVVDMFVTRATPEDFLDPDPAEVMDTAWISLSHLTDWVRVEPWRFTPWLQIYLAEGWGKIVERLQVQIPAHA